MHRAPKFLLRPRLDQAPLISSQPRVTWSKSHSCCRQLRRKGFLSLAVTNNKLSLAANCRILLFLWNLSPRGGLLYHLWPWHLKKMCHCLTFKYDKTTEQLQESYKYQLHFNIQWYQSSTSTLFCLPPDVTPKCKPASELCFNDGCGPWRAQCFWVSLRPEQQQGQSLSPQPKVVCSPFWHPSCMFQIQLLPVLVKPSPGSIKVWINKKQL